ncbi:50S rRNA methyltransferase [Clostridium sp. MF28]|uniref:Methyltransferase n=1 Tax=Clostridium diolis TaxID=223919 RepID=A0AAV3VUZ7_9CLOT|nr:MULTISPECIES: class I SAM-dependent rRNA methyltransferase [Clostridium]AVK48111.1 50S rRNA methyltransferase [Clostridium sp. MF28]OVE70543.1 class I SAM-dependent rRNA methyltransferase [Clostridium diolis]PSM57171.1 class I SAM-dependent rRNA methyltransferase [Clostridium diolis]QES75151.1 class I SAM-dependent rRNA methyltransferase [Clostridium diolis]GEA29122.1 methyltransferase [Clostridium diolis]
MKEAILTVKKEFVKKYKNGYPLILEEAFDNIKDLKEEGQIITLIDEKKTFLGKGYYGKQNKGCGWILSNSKNSNLDYKFFYDKIRNAFSKRMKFYHSKDTSAFRVFNGEGDGIGGLTIDYFDEYYLITWYSRGIYTFKDNIIKAIKSLVSFDGIYEKKRFEENGMVVDEDSYVCGRKAPEPLIVKENKVNFSIYLNDGAMVGVFLDQKEVRKSIKDKYSNNKKVLNTFSYTGAFSMAAAKGGAITTSVDLASRSLEKTTENFTINNIDFTKHEIIVEDIFLYFKRAKKEELKFDVVILDPPSFATSKDNRFSAAKDYKGLVKSAIDITEDEGVIVASTNCATFNMGKFKKFIDEAFKESHRNYEILEEHTLSEDFAVTDKFPEGNYLKVVIVKMY